MFIHLFLWYYFVWLERKNWTSNYIKKSYRVIHMYLLLTLSLHQTHREKSYRVIHVRCLSPTYPILTPGTVLGDQTVPTSLARTWTLALNTINWIWNTNSFFKKRHWCVVTLMVNLLFDRNHDYEEDILHAKKNLWIREAVHFQ